MDVAGRGSNGKSNKHIIMWRQKVAGKRNLSVNGSWERVRTKRGDKKGKPHGAFAPWGSDYQL